MKGLDGFIHTLLITQNSLFTDFGGPDPVRFFEAQLAFLAVLSEQLVMPVETIQDGLRNVFDNAHVPVC